MKNQGTLFTKREFDSAISAARRAAEMAQNGAPRFARGTILRVYRIHVYESNAKRPIPPILNALRKGFGERRSLPNGGLGEAPRESYNSAHIPSKTEGVWGVPLTPQWESGGSP